MTAERVFAALAPVLLLSVTLTAQQPEVLTDQPIAGPMAITPSASSARHCVAGQAANVHSLGWVAAGTSYAVTFESDIPLLTAVTRMDLTGNQSTASYGAGDLFLTAISPGTMALMVSGNGRAGCYRYKVQIEPPRAAAVITTAPSAARALAKPAKSPIQTLAISGAASALKQCVGGNGVAKVHSIGRLAAGANITLTFDSDFDAKASLVNVDLAGRTGTFSIDDDSGGNLDPRFDITTSHAGTLVLFVAGNNGASGCYHYRVDVTPAAAATPSPEPVPIPAESDPGPANFAGTWRGLFQSTACFDDGVLEGWCRDIPRISNTMVLVLTQNGGVVTGTMTALGVVTPVSGTVQGDRLSIAGRATLNSATELGYEDWNTSLSGSQLTGTFSIRVFPKASGVSGGARWAVSVPSATRTSSTGGN